MAINFPNTPTLGQSVNLGAKAYTWNGTAWEISNSGGLGTAQVTTDDVAPATPKDGDMWMKTTTGVFYVYYDDGNTKQWVQVAASPQISGVVPFMTPWQAYTPTLTGFGTATAVSMFSRRVGDTLSIRGKFTAATSTAVEARMTLGYNGTNGVIVSDAVKVPSIQLAGPLIRGFNVAANYYTLIESNLGYITFGQQSASANALTKALGNAISATGNVMSLQAEVPISGWSVYT